MREAEAPLPLVRKGASNVTNTAILVARSFALSVLAARLLGPERQGTYAVVLYVIQVLVQLVTLGLPATAVRYVARYHVGGDGPAVRGLLTYVARRGILFGLGATAACALLAGPLARALTRGAPPGLFFLAALAVVPEALTLLLEAGFEGLLAYETLLRVNLVMAPLSLATAALVLTWGGGIAGLLTLKVVLAAARVATYWFILGRRFPRPRPLAPSDRREVDGYARSLSLIFLFDTVVWQRSEVLFLGAFCTRTLVACYDIAYQVVGTVMRILPEKLADILLPLLAGLEHRSQRERSARVYREAARLLFGLTCGVAVCVGGSAPSLVRLVYGDAYAPAAHVIMVLCAAAPFIIVARATAYLLYAAGWQDFNVRLAGAAAVTNLLLAFILVPRHCLMGAAVANTFSQLASASILVTYVLRRSGASLPWGAMARTLLAACGQMAAMRALSAVVSGWVGLAATAGAGLVVYGLCLWLTRVVKPAEWGLVRGSVRTPGAGGRN